ncbi:type II secretion system major pseudopilin GspG [Nitratifractor sp.]|uniref:type II secretion system major pseudopilin GspG n=1 Tax=Nitratifractor sp. TaxID=2268144 RepID=UPI0025F8D026|nr:type II secretion system major pseudopilin GspG [Nitratifractor sp.]
MKKAFSLLELLVVILILGILAAFVAPNLIGVGEKAKRDLVCSQMSSVAQALKMFRLDNGTYPDTEEGLQALMHNPDTEKYPNYSTQPYLEKMPKDSWRTPIVYVKEGDKFDLISYGADRKEGGEGEAADIYYSRCQK